MRRKDGYAQRARLCYLGKFCNCPREEREKNKFERLCGSVGAGGQCEFPTEV